MEKKALKTGGKLRISASVVVKIAELAACEISGVACEGSHLATGDAHASIASRFISPVKVRLTNEAAEISVNIVTLQGYKAINVAEAVQASIKSAVQNMTGIAVAKVNVSIAGIEIKTEA